MLLNPCGTWAAAGELSWGVQAAATPVPTTYIGRDGGTKASNAVAARLRPNRRRVRALFQNSQRELTLTRASSRRHHDHVAFLYGSSSCPSRCAAYLATWYKKSLSLLRYLPTAWSQWPSRTSGTTLLSARLHTVRA